jgi:hypothetical protein
VALEPPLRLVRQLLNDVEHADFTIEQRACSPAVIMLRPQNRKMGLR